jgi:hypothetical protein
MFLVGLNRYAVGGGATFVWAYPVILVTITVERLSPL